MRTYVLPEGASAAIQETYAEILGIHAALLPTNHIVYFSGDQHDPGQFTNGVFDSARLFDCDTGAITMCVPAPDISDLFCCGHALLADGRVLIAGGTKRFAGFEGTPNSWIFDPTTRTFDAGPDMADGRWYPTLLTLGNGDVLAVSGINAAGTDQNRQLEVFAPSGATGTWTVRAMLPDAFATLYPRMHLLPDGRVLFVTPVGSQCATWAPPQTAPQPLCAPAVDPDPGFSAYTSVLLPLLPEEGYAARILVANIPQPRILDLTAGSPAWADTGPRNVPLDGVITNATPQRDNGMAVLLPTGDVLNCGGEESGGTETNPVHALEVYRPQTNSWITMPVSTTVNRNYHSVALLLPDGRVFMAGSDKGCKWSFHDPGDYNGEPQPTDLQETKTVGGVTVSVDNRELRIEIFEPWYVGRPDRPEFTLNASSASVGGVLQLTLSGSPSVSVSRVALLRAGTSTHAFDADQRYVGLTHTQYGNAVTATLPDNEHLLPPGPYLVIVLGQVVDPNTGSTLDVPSVGQWLRVHNTKHIKEIKFEIDNVLIKDEIENLHKLEVESIDPGSIVVDPDPTILQLLARAVDNLERRTAGLKPFITEAERPSLDLVPTGALDAVAIHPIDPELLARQQTMPMEGMTMTPDTASMGGDVPSPDGGMKMPGDGKGTDRGPAKKEVGTSGSRSSKAGDKSGKRTPT